jgi:predicted acyltransferase
MPINKNLWTSSFTLFTAGAAALICAGFYWLIEVRGYRRWATPLIIYGSNAIVIFVLAGLLGRLLGVISWVGPTGAAVTLKGWIYATAFVPYATPVNASLLFAVAFVLLHLLIAGLLWRRQWFVRI